MFQFRLTGIVVAALFAPLAAAQLAPQSDASAAQSPAEAVPEYQIEVIVFAHRDFNPNEEDFGHEREAIATASPAAPAPADTPQTLWPSTGIESEPATPALLDPLQSNPFESGSEPATASQPGATSESAITSGSAAMTAEPGTTTQPPTESGAANATAFHFRLLAPEEFALNGIYDTLERLSAYTPLLHGGWVQPGLPQEQARAFDLSLLGTVNPRGSIELYVSRFLHVNVDLSYEPQGGDAGYGWQGTDESSLGAFSLTPRYSLHAERRLKSGEVHYFDHPAFGVLVQIRPSPASAPQKGAEPAA
jgi:Peptidoglycan-binding protein, CsiV